jgi:hypothetical protein
MTPIFLDDIVRATGLGERAVRSWISRLGVVPVSIHGRAHLYPPTVVSDIQAAQIQSSLARRRRADVFVTFDGATTPAPAGTVITVAEAKRRAGRRTS